jgi:hypothetical protein
MTTKKSYSAAKPAAPSAPAPVAAPSAPAAAAAPVETVAPAPVETAAPASSDCPKCDELEVRLARIEKYLDKKFGF